MRSFRLAAAVAVLALSAAACGSSAPVASPQDAGSTVPPTVTTNGSFTSGPSSTPTVPGIASSTTTRAIPPTSSAPPSTVAAAALPDRRLADVAGAGQAVVVTASAYGDTTATLTAYERTAAGWKAVFGPWTARVGTRGLAPPGAKREGDGRTPSGVYGFDFFFGVAADPGVQFPYRRVASRSIVWDDDPASPLYDQWVDSDVQAPGADPEPMYVTPAYTYGAVIAYNTARTPGLGSAIFLHVSTGGPTAGCVSLPAEQLLQVLRWLDPARQPAIVVGVAA